jgi:hypothetical protein
MLFYIFLFVIIFLLMILIYYLPINEKKYLEILSLTFLIVISGTRLNIGGSDYELYKNVFDNIPPITIFIRDISILHQSYLTYNWEIGFLFIYSIIKTIGFNFYGFTLIHSLFFYVLLYVSLKKYTVNFNFLLLVFLYKMFFYNTFISMRQSISIVLFLYSIRYIEDRNILKYFLLSLVSFSIHYSAIFVFPLYFINSIKVTRNSLFYLSIIFMFTIIFSFLNLNTLRLFNLFIGLIPTSDFSNEANQLINSTSSSAINIIHTFEYFFILFLIILFYKDFYSYSSDSLLFIKFMLILLPLFTIFRGYEILTRLKDYLILAYPIILGYLGFMNKKRLLIPINIITVIVSAFGFFRFLLLFDNGALLPYKSYLFLSIGLVP